jgi:hypothetical protein
MVVGGVFVLECVKGMRLLAGASVEEVGAPIVDQQGEQLVVQDGNGGYCHSSLQWRDCRVPPVLGTKKDLSLVWP